MTFDLSVLDLSPVPEGSTSSDALKNTIDLAQHADDLGYKRYWLAEHHNLVSVASSSPEVMISSVAAATENIRVGSGGIMLPNHAPLKVAETFRVLEALHPDRIDLGLGRAPGTDGRTAYALRRTPGEDDAQAAMADRFPKQLAELFAFSGGGFPTGHVFDGIEAVPTDVDLPPVWLLGSSDYSAQASAQMGLGFAFAAHFSTMDPVGVMNFYRDNFEPSEHLKEPHAILAASVICAETDAEARHLARSMELSMLKLRSGRPIKLPTPEEAEAYPYNALEKEFVAQYRRGQVVGSPETVHHKLEVLARRTNADEVMVVSAVHDHEKRLASYGLLAEAFNLSAAA
ncbi:LLM class flavin-dependent oxidoreductase [Rubrobacter indicoceani]|uniref:LLM class flavin-dependent oxidoreductase n=1 Tax=Rubrobacter indicoceani TaxID=2051957 RepID=UPI000E5BF6CD|nr:LLM class flavin-dependent oxidoreductase [Rubrobacter indicoceani]